MFDFYHKTCDSFITMSKSTILIIDDDIIFVKKLSLALEGIFNIETCFSEKEFWNLYAIGKYDLLIVDMRLHSDSEGLTLLNEVFAQDTMQPAIIMTAYADMVTYTDAIQSGALTYLDKKEFSPVLIARIVEAIIDQGKLRRQTASFEQRIALIEPIEIIGASQGILKVREKIRYAATNDLSPILIYGEAGTGKKLIARNIHRFCPRRSGANFVYIPQTYMLNKDSVSFSETAPLLSGQNLKKITGWINEAKGGILFLEIFPEMDQNILFEIMEGIENDLFIGKNDMHTLKTDLRVIIGAELSQNVGLNKYSHLLDKYPESIKISAPTLRDRQEDIPLLAQYLLRNLFMQGRTRVRSFKGNAMAYLETLPWKGNVRELKIAIEYAAILADAAGAHEIYTEHLPLSISEAPLLTQKKPTAMDYQYNIARTEVSLVESVIEQFETTTKSEIAKILQYNDRFIFSRRIRQHLTTYPGFAREFPKTAIIFPVRASTVKGT